MNRSTLRNIILVTSLITALVHLVWLNYTIFTDEGHLDLLFTLNGLGYLGLLGIFLLQPIFVVEQWEFFHYVFMAFAAVTIVAFFILGGTGFGGRYFDPVGYATKLDELILITALWKHMQKGPELAGG